MCLIQVPHAAFAVSTAKCIPAENLNAGKTLYNPDSDPDDDHISHLSHQRRSLQWNFCAARQIHQSKLDSTEESREDRQED